MLYPWDFWKQLELLLKRNRVWLTSAEMCAVLPVPAEPSLPEEESTLCQSKAQLSTGVQEPWQEMVPRTFAPRTGPVNSIFLLELLLCHRYCCVPHCCLCSYIFLCRFLLVQTRRRLRVILLGEGQCTLAYPIDFYLREELLTLRDTSYSTIKWESILTSWLV